MKNATVQTSVHSKFEKYQITFIEHPKQKNEKIVYMYIKGRFNARTLH